MITKLNHPPTHPPHQTHLTHRILLLFHGLDKYRSGDSSRKSKFYLRKTSWSAWANIIFTDGIEIIKLMAFAGLFGGLWYLCFFAEEEFVARNHKKFGLFQQSHGHDFSLWFCNFFNIPSTHEAFFFVSQCVFFAPSLMFFACCTFGEKFSIVVTGEDRVEEWALFRDLHVVQDHYRHMKNPPHWYWAYLEYIWKQFENLGSYLCSFRIVDLLLNPMTEDEEEVSERSEAKRASLVTKECEATNPLLIHSCSRASLKLRLASLGAGSQHSEN